MKSTLKKVWTNCQSAGYTALTLIGIILVLVGSLLALPIVLVLVVGAIIFISYKVGIAADAVEKEDLNDPDWYLKPVKRYRNDDKP
jgi:hypothetical protein